MQLIRYVCFLLVLCLSLQVNGQSIDSLQIVADTTLNPNLQAKLSWELVAHYDSVGQPALALKNAKTTLTVAQKTMNDFLASKAYLQLAKSSIDLGRQDDAVEYLRLYSLVSAEVLSESKVEELQSDMESLQNSQRALENYTKSLEGLLDAEKEQNLSNKIYANNYYNYLVAAVIALGVFTVVFILSQIRASKRLRSALNRNTESFHDLAVERDALKEEVAELKQLVTTNTKSSNVGSVLAQRIQTEFLDYTQPIQKRFPHTFKFSKAREVASGDYLWSGHHKGKTIVLLADTGLHGIGATYFILLISQLMKRLTDEDISAPTMILTMLDQHIRSRIAVAGSEDFYGIKAAVLTFQKSPKEVQIASAMLPVYHTHKGELQVIEGDHQPIGGLGEGEKFFETKNVTLHSKDLIYLFTDGFEDQLGGKTLNRFTRPSIRKLISSISNQKLEEQSFMIEKVFNDWRKSQPQTDDVTVLGIRI